MLAEEQLTQRVIGIAIRIHQALGPGLLEKPYDRCFCYGLAQAGIPFQRRVAIPVVYEGVKIDCGFWADVIVDGRVIVEIKALENLHPIHQAQLMTYLRLSGLHVGLLLNFGARVLKEGIIRRVI
jgi:GxxExxY protein